MGGRAEGWTRGPGPGPLVGDKVSGRVYGKEVTVEGLTWEGSGP